MSLLPSQDPFYDAVSCPPGPGVPVRVREVEVPTTVPSSVRQVVHGSTGTHGPVAVSGTVLVPEEPWTGEGPRPVLSLGVGLHGLDRDSAPSRLLVEGSEPDLPLVSAALERGWAVAVTDGEGLGMPGPHTCGAGRPGGHSMLDVARAAQVVAAGVSPGSPCVLWGYSEGGRNAAWAAELHPTYAPDVPLVAVAAGGVPADVYETAQAVDAGPYSGLGLAVLVGLAHAYDDPRLWSVLSFDGYRAAQRAATLDIGALVAEHPQPMRMHTRCGELWDDAAWRSVLAAERNGERAPQVPTYLYHVTEDELVPVRLGRELALQYRSHGAEVTWVEVDASGHLAGGPVAAPGALAWLAARLAAGRPASSLT